MLKGCGLHKLFFDNNLKILFFETTNHNYEI
jgi:hypothetical protein